ncbi:MAG: YdcF family protein [Bacteroidota bacterium]
MKQLKFLAMFRSRKTWRVLKWAFGGLALWVTVHVTVIVVDGLRDELEDSVWAVVFGNKVNPDRSLSPRLKARMDKALWLYREKLVDSIFVSGGVGVEGHPEGTVMRDYLVENGVPSGIIVVDNAGVNSQATALNFRQLGVRKSAPLLLISQYYHLSRAKLALRRAGFTHVGGVHADFQWEWRDIWSISREFVGFYAYLFRDFD